MGAVLVLFLAPHRPVGELQDVPPFRPDHEPSTKSVKAFSYRKPKYDVGTVVGGTDHAGAASAGPCIPARCSRVLLGGMGAPPGSSGQGTLCGNQGGAGVDLFARPARPAR